MLPRIWKYICKVGANSYLVLWGGKRQRQKKLLWWNSYLLFEFRAIIKASISELKKNYTCKPKSLQKYWVSKASKSIRNGRSAHTHRLLWGWNTFNSIFASDTAKTIHARTGKHTALIFRAGKMTSSFLALTSCNWSGAKATGLCMLDRNIYVMLSGIVKITLIWLIERWYGPFSVIL